MKMMKRALALLLCIVMVVGLVPATVFAADGGGISAQANDEPIYVLAGGDFQEAGDHAGSAENVRNILAQISKKYETMNGFLFVGDYDCETHESDDNGQTAAGINALMGAVQNSYSNINDANSILVQGNHDIKDSRIDATGGHDFDGYAVFVMNEDDYPDGGGTETGVKVLAGKLETWLNGKLGEGYDAPIFITSHLPLAFSPRTNVVGDGKYAKLIFDVLNHAAGEGLNIIFMHGHNHAYGNDNYLGGEAIYLPVGEKINIAEQGSTTNWTEETLKFTYMNAGYVGYYNDWNYVTTEGTDKLTMTVFKIENNQVTVERYSANGLYNLKSEGRNGRYVRGNEASADSLKLAYNTTIYESPQTISLGEAEDYGDIGTWVGVEAEVTDNVTTSNKGWVEVIAPVPGIEAVPGSTTYKYVLDFDGVNTNTKYLIVNTSSNGDAYVLTNDNGGVSKTRVTIRNREIIVDDETNINWIFSGSESGTIVNQNRYLYLDRYTKLSLTQSGTNATFSSQGNGAYKIYRFSNSRYNYLRYSNGAWSKNSSNNPNNVTSVYLFAYDSTITTPDTPATQEKNGTYGKIVGNLTFTVPYVGYSEVMAMDALKEQIDGYYYEAMSTPDTNVTGTKVDDSVLTWEWVDAYNGNVPGDYEVAIKYGDFLLGTAEVIVPATKTYYIAEGNGLYIVPMNTTEANALAAVKAGVTVSSASDDKGTNKQTISDDDVTWKWVDTYNGTDSGPYTVDILYNGTSLGTVEVKVNVQYETGIEEDWTYIGQTESTGGTHTYTLDTDGIDSDGQYIIVAENQAIALHTSGSSAAAAISVNISSDGKTLTTSTRDYEYYWNSTYGFTRVGYNGLYQSSWAIYLGEKSASYLDGVVSHNNGKYTLYDNEGNERGLYYNGSSWTVNDGGTTTDYKVRLYKYTGTTGGTPAGPIYALVEGNTVYTVNQGSSATKALAAVKAGITGYLATDANGTGKTEIEDSELTWKWKNTFNGNSTGSYWVEISYEGKVLGTVEVQVKPGSVDNHPEYPDEGAVKVNKTATGIDFQSSGIAQIELSASGVPSKKGADVIIMLDTSSSMESWCVCGTQNCTSTGTTHKRRSKVLEESLVGLIAQFKSLGDDGELLDIDVAIADFNGFYGDNHNASGTPYDRDAGDMMSDDISYNANSEAQIYTGDHTLGAGAFVANEDLATTYTLNYASGTNYDYAMDAIYQMATAKKEANGGEDRDLFVIFLSDGAPMQWNYYHSQGQSSLWNNWITGSWTANQLSLNCNTHAYYYDEVDHDGDGMRNEHRMANAIKGDPSEQYEVIRKTNTLGTPTGEDNMYMVPGLGATMFAISFGAQNDGNVTKDSMHIAIDSLASDQGDAPKPYHYHVTSAEELVSAFTAIGSEIAYAANNARFVDQMGNHFNLQMKPVTYSVVNGTTTINKTLTPTIEILSYDIYTRQDYLSGKCAIDQIGNRKGSVTVLETVRFSADGTKAYSDQIDSDNDGIKGWTVAADGTIVFDDGDNILADGTKEGFVKGIIYAKTFIYNTNILAVEVDGVSIPAGENNNGTTTKVTTNVLPSETFYWKMGTIQTSELAMRYYVYLDGSMEGTKPAGSYATNEFAVLYYDNYLGNSCFKGTVSPSVAWKSANVSYAFYLVNEKGEIVVNQATGKTGSFANKVAVTNPVVYEEILLNNTNQISVLDVKAADDDVLPKYYTLYDSNAVYAVTINSNATGMWTIEQSADKVASTYVTQYKTSDASAYSNALTNGTVGDDYTHTVVWFAVVWSISAHPDSVVVDYGLPVDISVLSNDMFGSAGNLAGIGAVESLPEGYDNGNMHTSALNTGFSADFNGKYGNAHADVKNGLVRYTLNSTAMNSYEKFAYAVQYTGSENAGYYYDTVTVIPATTIYYEDNFVNLESYTWSSGWQKVDKGNEKWVWSQEGTVVDATQSEDRPGIYSLTDANNIYGYDSVNKSMGTYSMGAAMKAGVDYDNYGLASFTFYGTGFDIISMTNNTTGTIYVDVYQGDNLVEGKSFIVDTYYGYHQVSGDANGDGTIEDGELVWAVNPDATDSIYQVPVMKVDGLPYGKYTAKITVFYSPVYDNVDGSTGYDFYLDAIRIYDPANDGAADTDNVIENAYKADGEGWPSYIELRNMLIDPNGDGNTDDGAFGNADTSTKVEGVVFIDGDASVGEAQLTDYINYGPNNEVYLAPGQRVAFMLNTPDNVDRIHIGLKSADGAKVTYTITNIAQSSGVTAGQWYNARTYTLDTTTDMYYDMTDWKKDIIVISNTGDRYNTNGILSITNIKSTYISNPNGTNTPNEVNTVDLANETTVYMTASAAMLTLRAVNTMDLPEILEPEQSEVSGDRNHDQKDEKTWIATFDAEEIGERITEQAENLCATVKRSKRMKADGTYDEPKMGEYLVHIDPVVESVTVEAKKNPEQIAKDVLKGLPGGFFG